uniref:Solute carrier family 16 member 6a n=1 Tax=Salarias fasciatus TaxID=181472 RepID=A0A672J310_SALFA
MGYCLTFLPTVTILSQYFSSRRSLVTAVASTGESLSMFALAPAFSALRDHIGWRRTMATMGGLQSVIIVCGALLRPIVIKPPTAREAEVDRLSANEQEASGTQKEGEGAGTEGHATNQGSVEANATYSLENEQTTGSVSTGDSGIQSLKDTDCSSQEENAPLHKDGTLKAAERQRSEPDKPSCGAAEEPADETPPVKKAKLLDFSILRECTFILYSLFGLFATLGFFAPQLYIIVLSVSRGVEHERAAYMLSIMAVAEILGRFSIGWVMTRKPLRRRKLLVMLACVLVMAVDLVGFTLVTEFYGLAVCSSVYGFFMGTLACTHIPMLAEDDVVGIDRMSSAAGVYVFIHSFAGLAGPPMGGKWTFISRATRLSDLFNRRSSLRRRAGGFNEKLRLGLLLLRSRHGDQRRLPGFG